MKAKSRIPKNEKRASNVVPAFFAYKNQVGGDWCDVVPDLLSDTMHWCEQTGHDFEKYLETARLNYEAEKNGED